MRPKNDLFYGLGEVFNEKNISDSSKLCFYPLARKLAKTNGKARGTVCHQFQHQKLNFGPTKICFWRRQNSKKLTY